MKILVDGKEAALKSDLHFEYMVENRLFLGRDGYTLSISFPLKHCSRNLAIFGHLNRIDVSKANVSFECAIIDSKISIFGTLSVVKISDVEVECQFAEGRCEQSILDPFENTYIHDLDLGTPSVTDPSLISPTQAWKDIDGNAEAVALPWINESYPDVPNNWVKYENGAFSWDPEVKTLSWQPYLIVIAKRICAAIGYSYDFSVWEASNYRFLIICNSIPGSWYLPQFASALPEWTVSEFFEKLELFLMCEFDFDHRARSVTMNFSHFVIRDKPAVCIENVIDSYSVEVSPGEDSRCEYIASKRFAYKTCSHHMQPFYSCDWFLSKFKRLKSYETLDSLISKNKRVANNYGVFWGEPMGDGYDPRLRTVAALLYAEDVKTHFVFRSIGTEKLNISTHRPFYTQIYILQPINVFGSGTPDDDSVPTEEIEFVPACISDTYVSADDDKGLMMFLSPPDSFDSSELQIDPSDESAISRDPSAIYQPGPAAALEKGDNSGSTVAYNEIYLAFWRNAFVQNGVSPYPIVDWVRVGQEWSPHVYSFEFSMRLYGNPKFTTADFRNSLPKIDTRHKFKFSWIAQDIPDPRAIFHIAGKRYVCEKITASFTEDGMSELMKGEFWPLAE